MGPEYVCHICSLKKTRVARPFGIGSSVIRLWPAKVLVGGATRRWRSLLDPNRTRSLGGGSRNTRHPHSPGAERYKSTRSSAQEHRGCDWVQGGYTYVRTTPLHQTYVTFTATDVRAPHLYL